MQRGQRVVGWWAALVVGLAVAPPATGQELSGPLVVYNAGSLAAPFRELLQAFVARHPGVRPMQESSGSLEAARKLTELGKTADLLAVADYLVIPAILIPAHATWYVSFARNALVLAHQPRSIGAPDIGPTTWPEVLLRPGVRTGRSAPELDPGGYRALFAYQLIARHRNRPGLADSLLAAAPRRFVRAKSSDLVALLQSGELDYAWLYRSTAVTARLPYVEVGPEVDLSDPGRAGWYAHASVRLPGPRQDSDSITVRGESIVFALTIPTSAPNRPAAEAFVRFVLSAEGQVILSRQGFVILAPPLVAGPSRPPASVLP